MEVVKLTEKRILFDKFEFPVKKGLRYLVNEGVAETDFLLINEPNDRFSMTFEKDFPIFNVPENSDRSYCLLEIKRPGRMIKFFCPEKHKNLDSVVWYFYVDLLDAAGVTHRLPGQITVDTNDPCIRMMKGKPPFFEVLETVKLSENYA